jgi:hypothetical protein
MAKITASGVYDLTMEEYRGQPADGMSLSASDAILLGNYTPAHLKASWAEEAEDEGSSQSDFGTLIHTMILEPHLAPGAIVQVFADDWRSKDARTKRDEARAAGKLPVLEKDVDRAQAAVAAVMRHPLAAALLKDGKAEQSWFAKDKDTGLYRKARPDFYTSNRILVDIKTVASAHPDFLMRRVYDGGWFQQAPFHCDVAERVEGSPVRGYCWLIVEQKPPHAVVIRKPTDTILMHGDRLNKQAWETFARCVKTDQWPAWGETLEDLALPTYAFYRLEDEAQNKPSRGLEALAWAEQTGADPRA